MWSSILKTALDIPGKVLESAKHKRELQQKKEESQANYLKEKINGFVFTSAALTVIIPTMMWVFSPVLKYFPFMTEVLNDYQGIINDIGMERLFYIISALLLGSAVPVGIGAVGKIKMAVRKEDNRAAIEKEKIVRGVVGDSFVSLKPKGKMIPKVKKFITKFAPYAIEAEKKYGLPAAGVLAHAALETGWGNHILTGYPPNGNEKIATNNIFNIKKSSNWTGPTVSKEVWEERNGQNVDEVHEFKVYSDFQESFNDYAKLLTTVERYKKVDEEDDPNEYGRALYDCGYMTDSRAPDKIKRIIEKYFDYET